MQVNNITKVKKFQQLCKKERQLIQQWYLKHISISEIARRLNHNKSTISRQVNNKKNLDFYRKHNGYVIKTYSAIKAEENYIKNKSKCGAKYKLFKDKNLVKDLEDAILKNKLSPDAFIGRSIRLGWKYNISITVHSIYNYIDRNQLKIKPMDLLMKVKRKVRKANNADTFHKKNKRRLGLSIEERDSEISLREEFGHWEGDCVVDKSNNGVFVLSERKTRMYFVFKLKHHNSESVMEKMRYLKRKFGKNFRNIFKTITVDNGSEFWKMTECQKWKTKIYFTHPYSSWEKGTVENCNGILRRYIAKGKDIKSINRQTIESCCMQINNIPRKILNYQTANECFEKELTNIFSIA